MIEPDSGTVLVGGRNIMDVDRVELRRSIGYVIQQIGLFPHLTIAENVAPIGPSIVPVWDSANFTPSASGSGKVKIRAMMQGTMP